MHSKGLITLAVASVCAASTAQASTFSTDARSMGMGNTGVVTADFLTAPFHNPALGAAYRAEDDIGLLIPAIGVTVQDSDDALAMIDDVQDHYDSMGRLPSQEEYDTLDQYLNDLSGAKPINVNGGIAFSISIPNQYASVNVFSSTYVEIMANPLIGDEANAKKRYENSEVALIGFGVAELGLALSKEYILKEQTFSFGISPKLQELRTYSDVTALDDFDIDDYEDSEVSDTVFNVDVGAIWYKDNWRVGLVGKNLIKQEIETKNSHLTYELAPKVTIGGGYITELFTVSIDADLTSQERFSMSSNATQFVRAGVEFNAWGWAQLRAGYETDLEDTLEDSVTAGIGISPWDIVSFDLAASYAGDNQFGVSANLAMTF
ncbi:conjugal transfer protein TraF [Vibrio sp. 99-70-13A1]|uniref:conjugal transfer protein TraF n=1 Tax=Vibrio sp. 99-70-13A1 TaxID=2607601 RepID=UPI0014933CEB|nr:conjugal transfer protein TraF [Vibrio sp. 99-70-13A1]NOH98948.1 type IX secretion system membrane protein PorP/SprF [Vibrio sp. 99-70-13A1]